ncbi:hypothetical protein [Azospirillum sp. TSO5]|uniref:hypothetical protein n=1 Tax=Azospirillum sp. TSO5 TaxID=716760 RepID=UPI0013048A06|nr:hypothetical protein [Azospirillum sp. TSO5]
MAPLPRSIPDPTLEAADRALEVKGNRKPGPRLGMGVIGDECARKPFYQIRWVAPVFFDATSIKRFDDGHRTEDLMAERLRLVQGVTLLTVDPETGRQFGFKDHGGHFRGFCDGKIIGILQAPKTWHVWEGKTTNEDKQKKLEKLKADLGEKNALRAWDFTYFVQAQLYMHYTGFDRHYLTCASPGGRSTVSVRTEADPAEAMRHIAKARRVIFSDVPPERVSSDPSFFKCRFCDFSEVCHGSRLPQRNCRTCAFSEAVEDGEGSWRCARHEDKIPLDFQYTGCGEHRFNPNLVPGEQIDAAPDASFISYQMRDGSYWTDEGPQDGKST